MTHRQPYYCMPAFESLFSLLFVATGAAALSIVVGNEAASAAADAAAAAQTLKGLTDEMVVWYSLAGGFAGAIVSWAFGLLPRSLAEGSRAVLGSAITAAIFAPGVIVYFHFPQTIIPITTISGTIGIIANAAVIKLFPVLVNLLPDWLKNLFKIRGMDTSSYDMSNDRPHSEKGKKTERLTRTLGTPPPRRRQADPDDGSNEP